MTLAITTLALTIMAITGIVQIRRQIDVEQHRSADVVAQGIARASERAMASGDKEELSRLARTFQRDENVLFIAIYGGRGQNMAGTVRDQSAWDEFLRGEVDTARCVVGKCRVESSGGMSGHDAAETVGRIFVGISTRESIEAQVHQSRLMAVAAVAAGLGAAGILFLILGPWIRRLQRLNNASKSISRGDFSGYVCDPNEDPHDDELGQLAQSFDAMCRALWERESKLHDFTETLQDQVKQRTSDLELALASAEEASRAKSLFLANMSHELRTPLNGVIGMVDLLLTADPNPQQRRYCDVAKSSARSLLELINDILDFSKIEAGKLELDTTDFDLHQVIEGVTQMLGERAEKKRIELICGLGEGVPRIVSGDPVRLRQVIVNLMTNAIKFTDSGEVVLDVVLDAMLEEQTDSHAIVKFSVRDSGIGIPKDRLDRLFKSFSQVDASTTRKFGGTGLGLAISQRLVEMMGGRIGVESHEGKGSTFWFTARFEKRPQVLSTRREFSMDLRGLRALAVDDNATNREILQAQLASWSLRAEVADGAARAMQLLREAAGRGEPYRFAILDMHMPDTDGVQLAREIKADPATRDVVLISLSSICDTMKPNELTDLGFAASLTKPALPSQLYNAIVESLASTKPGDRAADRSEATETSIPRLTGVKILLAEDNEVNRMVASELLEQAGCICTMVVNGREALDEGLRQDYDAILMDCQMPELDGFEATRAIRDAEKAAGGSRHRTIIALTANAIKGDRELCLAAGMDGYVTKPIDPVELMRTIRSFLSARRAIEVQEQSAAAGFAAILNNDGKESAAPAADAAPPVDLDSLQRRCMGNRKLAAKALSKFDSSMTLEMSALVESVRRGDAKSVAASAHKIKGAAANVSAGSVRQIVAELEQLAKSDELAQTESCLEQLDREVIRFREYLSTALADLAPGVSAAPGEMVVVKGASAR
jgi:signal transduction histidine kinase/DNA-binding response OmpR family regulator